MTSQQATNQKPDDEGDELHRLRDIVVEEVSLVDRAANKRRFLVVKRSEDMPEDADTPRPEDGNAAIRTLKAKKKPKGEPEADETEKARKRPASTHGEDEETDEAEEAQCGAVGTDEAKKKVAPPKQPEEDEEDEPTTKARQRRGTTVGDEPEANEEFAEGTSEKKADAAPSIPKSLKGAMLQSLAEALERLMKLASQVKASSEPDEDTENDGLSEEIEEELEAIAELIENAAEVEESKRGAKKKAVAKAGARMAKDRLDRFQKALALLSDVLKELTEAKAPKEPTAGAAETDLRKRDVEAAPGMRELITGIGELTRVVKRQEEELGRIRQARGLSNAIPVEGGGRRSDPRDVSWPLDMNRPISRDSVAKAVSFYDE
jgi:hypothetical protein